MRTKLLLASIAALFLATGTAHAEDVRKETPRGGARALDACLEGNQEACEVVNNEAERQRRACAEGNQEACGPMCPAPQDETGNPTEIPCAELGVAYDCKQTVEAGAEPDEIWINHGHIFSDLNSVTITVYLPNMASRKSRRYPVIHYDAETDEITLDGKPCHPVGG